MCYDFERVFNDFGMNFNDLSTSLNNLGSLKNLQRGAGRFGAPPPFIGFERPKIVQTGA